MELEEESQRGWLWNGACCVFGLLWLMGCAQAGAEVAADQSCAAAAERAMSHYWGLPSESEKAGFLAMTLDCEDPEAGPAEMKPSGRAMTFLGLVLYASGRDPAAGIEELHPIQPFSEGAREGDPLAMVAAGDVFTYDEVQGDLADRKLEVGFELYRQAADAGSALGMSKLAHAYYEGRAVEVDLPRAHQWFLAAAKAGDPTAMHNVGHFLAEGKVVARDVEAALRWYEAAGQAGIMESFHNIAVLYDDGRAGVEDNAEAVRYYRQAAEGGLADAMLNLGWMLKHGEGTARDPEEAAQWYKKAFDAGLDMAAANLSTLYLEGEDLGAAYFWTLVMLDRGFQQASLRIVELQGRLAVDRAKNIEGKVASWERGRPVPDL